MFKRIFDVLFSLVIIIITFPILSLSMILVFIYDYRNPIYSAKRVGKDNVDFNMFKIRSMIMNADANGVTSTSSDDKRITPVGALIRKTKLDELSQFINVLFGSMSVVGPRPNTRKNGVEYYTNEEMHILDVKPGITDLASIVFSTEGEILQGSQNPDKDYNEKIRPLKSQLALFYVKHKSIWLDIMIVILTVICVFDNSYARRKVIKLLSKYSDGSILIEQL